MMARRISGSDGCGGGPLGATFFSPTRSLQAPVLQIGKGDAGHQRVPMQAGPGAALEVAKPKFLLELLVHLLGRPARLDGGGQPPQRQLLNPPLCAQEIDYQRFFRRSNFAMLAVLGPVQSNGWER